MLEPCQKGPNKRSKKCAATDLTQRALHFYAFSAAFCALLVHFSATGFCALLVQHRHMRHGHVYFSVILVHCTQTT